MWKLDQKEGFGRYFYNNSTEYYEGNWLKNNKEGIFRIKTLDGYILFEGNCKND